MQVNERSLYRENKPFLSVLSTEQEEVAFQISNCMKTSAQSWWNSYRILNYCCQAFPHTAGAQVSLLANVFSSQESRGCSACPWGVARDSGRSAVPLLSPPHILCRQTRPNRFFCIARWPQGKAGESWGSSLPLYLLCVEGRVWVSTTDLAEFAVYSVQAQPLLLTACGNVPG